VINDIVIFEKRFGLQDNMIMAKSGVMRVTPDKKFLEFILYNGWRYQEKGYRATTNTEFTRLNFKEYKKVFDLKSFQMNKTVDVFYDPKMLSVRQLGKAIDSIQSMDSFFIKKATIEIYPYLKFMLLKDSTELYNKVNDILRPLDIIQIKIVLEDNKPFNNNTIVKDVLNNGDILNILIDYPELKINYVNTVDFDSGENDMYELYIKLNNNPLYECIFWYNKKNNYFVEDSIKSYVDKNRLTREYKRFSYFDGLTTKEWIKLFNKIIDKKYNKFVINHFEEVWKTYNNDKN
jgi:hypothetical protein